MNVLIHSFNIIESLNEIKWYLIDNNTYYVHIIEIKPNRKMMGTPIACDENEIPIVQERAEEKRERGGEARKRQEWEV